MFAAAKHTLPEHELWLDKLDLELNDGTWQPVSLFNEAACDDCWETTREYYVTLITAGGAVTYIANDRVTFIVVPVQVDGRTLYRIRRCDDIRKSG
jgi:hypothetical protein